MPTCRECGAEIAPQKGAGAPKQYCRPECKRTWQNRKALRGRELYDFVMAWRFERDRTDMLGQLTRLASAYRDADNALRKGRKSWNAEEAQMRLPLGYGTDGDTR